MKPEDRAWFADQMTAYHEEYDRYASYASFLEDALTHMVKDALFPHAVIQARPKTKASFAGKILRKIDRYKHSINKPTDLCGGRIVVHTKHEVARVGALIRKHFEIDEANSLDADDRLRASEFGYRAMHLIVTLSQAKVADMPLSAVLRERAEGVLKWQGSPAALDRAGKPVILSRTAEIQVRTIPQHTWADIGHDRLYKTDFAVPYRWEREFARIAALLEDVDDAFMRIVEGLSMYQASYGVYRDEKKMREELEILEMMLSYDKGNVELTEQAVRIAFCLAEWATVNRLVAAFPAAASASLKVCDGLALYRQGKDGQAALDAALAIDPLNVEALAGLAEHNREEDKDAVLRLYHRAFEIDPTKPGVLGGYLRFKLSRDHDRSFLPLIRPTLEAAIAKCRELAQVGIDLPWAYRHIGEFNLLLARPDERLDEKPDEWPEHDERNYQSLHAFAKAVQLLRETSSSQAMLDEWLRALDALREVKPPLEGLDWARRLLLLGKAVSTVDGKSDPRFQKLRTSAADLVPVDKARPVVIVAGGCDPVYQSEMAGYRDLLFKVFKDFKGTLYSGGTTAGISGIVGELARSSGGAIHAFGYVPSNTPARITADEKETGYTRAYPMRGRDPRFSPLQPLQNWIDLIGMGVDPCDVKLLGINGGRISAFEYRLALALGAQVGLIVDSGREAGSLQADPDWRDDHGLVLLRRDAKPVKDFLDRPRVIHALARVLHEEYLRQNKPRDGKEQASFVAWRDLPEHYREANRRAAADHLSKLLAALGITAVPVKDRAIALYTIPEADVDRVAQLEHANWMAEKVDLGWRWGEPRNEELKLHPDIKPWNELLDWVREKNRNMIRRIPRLLMEVGLEVRPALSRGTATS